MAYSHAQLMPGSTLHRAPAPHRDHVRRHVTPLHAPLHWAATALHCRHDAAAARSIATRPAACGGSWGLWRVFVADKGYRRLSENITSYRWLSCATGVPVGGGWCMVCFVFVGRQNPALLRKLAARKPWVFFLLTDKSSTLCRGGYVAAVGRRFASSLRNGECTARLLPTGHS